MLIILGLPVLLVAVDTVKRVAIRDVIVDKASLEAAPFEAVLLGIVSAELVVLRELKVDWFVIDVEMGNVVSVDAAPVENELVDMVFTDVVPVGLLLLTKVPLESIPLDIKVLDVFVTETETILEAVADVVLDFTVLERVLVSELVDSKFEALAEAPMAVLVLVDGVPV